LVGWLTRCPLLQALDNRLKSVTSARLAPLVRFSAEKLQLARFATSLTRLTTRSLVVYKLFLVLVARTHVGFHIEESESLLARLRRT
jgi:hypothetical protein